MPLLAGEIPYFVFDLFSKVNLVHAVFTRRGGVSPAPWDSLNVGSTVGDDLARVRQNRERAFRALGRDPESLYDVWQVHGAQVAVATAPRRADEPHVRADAILTDTPSVTLFMRFADCVPILLCDPHKRVVGLVHAGWRGTVQRAAGAAVEAMRKHFGCRPVDIPAGIGPSIGPDHYVVGEEVESQARQAFGEQAASLLPQRNGELIFDLWAANRLVLEQAGVETIEVAGVCTACHRQDWYSHRAEQGKTGRFGALIGLC